MERADESRTRSHLDAVRPGERRPALKPADGIAKGDRVVKRPERVDTHVETRIRHAGAHIVGEAAAKQHHAFGVSHSDRTGSAFDPCLEFQHFYGLFVQKYAKRAVRNTPDATYVAKKASNRI
jgi:hypothetical protein